MNFLKNPHQNPQFAHLLKPKIHDNFSKDPALALINLSQTSPQNYLNLWTQTLKKLGLKKSLILFSPELSQHFSQNSSQNTSKYISIFSDPIIALTERPGGFILRGSSGKEYPAQNALILLDQVISLRQSSNLLIQNLDAHGYLIPENPGLIHSGPKLSDIGQSLSEYPRISEKLFLLNLSSNNPNNPNNPEETFIKIIQFIKQIY